MTPTDELILSTERKIERRLDEHTQMQVMLERCANSFYTLAELGNITPGQAKAARQVSREILALLKKVNS